MNSSSARLAPQPQSANGWILSWVVLLVAATVALLWLDAPLHRLAVQFGAPRGAATVLTALGAAPGMLIALLVSLLGGRRAVLRVLGVLLADGIAVNVLKHLIGRGRPYFTDSPWVFHGLSWAGDLTSMPSGHTSVAAALAVVVTRLAPRWRVPAWILVGLVAASRLVLNMHWASDVITGALLGSVVGWLVLRALDRFGY